MSRIALAASSALGLVLAGCAGPGVAPPPIQVAPPPQIVWDGDAPSAPPVLAATQAVSLGQSLAGELIDGDSRSAEDGLFDRYVLDLAAGQRVEVVMRSDVFDAYLIVGVMQDGEFIEIGRDDDGLGEGVNSRLLFTAVSDGRYEVRSRGFAAGGAGAYSLVFADLGQSAPPPPPGSVAIGAQVSGALSATDAVFDGTADHVYDAYRFSARAGDRLEMTARSTAFDTVLTVGRGSQWGGWEQLGYDDDGLGEGLNSRLRFIAPEDGDYIVRLTSFSAGAFGDYSLDVGEMAPLPGAQPIQAGQTLEGAVTGQDGMDDDGQRMDPYAFSARAGDRMEIVGRSDAFDMTLELGQRIGEGGWTQLAYDDDGLGEGLNSRLRYTIPSDGTYEVRVRPLDGATVGGYTVSLTDRGPPPPPPPPGAISTGASVAGSLSDTDGSVETEWLGERYFDDYRINVRRGQRLAVTLRSDDMDTLVQVGRYGADGAFISILEDDDSAGDLDARAIFTPDSNASYIVRATSFSGGEVGDYALSVRDLGQPARPRRLRLGQDVSGALSEGDSLSEAEGRYDAYGFRLNAGDRAQFIVRSEAFDTLAAVMVRGDDGRHELLVYDDDGLGEGTNSRLIFTAAETGTYEFWVAPFDIEGMGAYTLETEALGPAPQPAAIQIGAAVSGSIEPLDGLSVDGTYYDAFRFSGQAGQRVRVEMRSGDFDTFVLLGQHGPGGLQSIAEDDDGMGEGTDSRITVTLPTTGEYEVWATTFGGGQTGLYELRLIDLGPAPLPGSVVVGSTVRGSLSDEDAQDENGSFYDAYRVQFAEGEQVRITVTSNAFDTMILVGRMVNGVFQMDGSDDDGLSDTNSRLDFTATAAGEYILRVRSYTPGDTGEYVLTIEPTVAG